MFLAARMPSRRRGKSICRGWDSQNDDEYRAYKARAAFFGATARTVEGYLDLIFSAASCARSIFLPPSFCRHRSPEKIEAWVLRFVWDLRFGVWFFHPAATCFGSRVRGWPVHRTLRRTRFSLRASKFGLRNSFEPRPSDFDFWHDLGSLPLARQPWPARAQPLALTIQKSSTHPKKMTPVRHRDTFPNLRSRSLMKPAHRGAEAPKDEWESEPKRGFKPATLLNRRAKVRSSETKRGQERLTIKLDHKMRFLISAFLISALPESPSTSFRFLPRCTDFAPWVLGFVWGLEFGVWDFRPPTSYLPSPFSNGPGSAAICMHLHVSAQKNPPPICMICPAPTAASACHSLLPTARTQPAKAAYGRPGQAMACEIDFLPTRRCSRRAKLHCFAPLCTALQ